MTSVQNQGNQQLQQINPQVKPTVVQPQIIPPVEQQPLPQQNYMTSPQTQTQTAPPPSYAGVNIQIYNPSVGIPNNNPTGNAPLSQSLPGIAYPSNYYTQQYGLPGQGNIVAQGGQGGQGGNAVINNNITGGVNGSLNGAGENSEGNASANSGAANLNDAALAARNMSDSTKSQTSATIDKETVKTEKTEEKKKTEKRKVVELSDDYIKNLENYLNSQDKEVRMMGAKEVVARLQEDDSRKDDPALTALINKMLQDPSQQIKFLALSMLDSRTCTGDDYTIGVLKKMQNSTSGYGQDAAQATNILLKMSGKVVEKEFEVADKSDKK